jgi:hypothetical protein
MAIIGNSSVPANPQTKTTLVLPGFTDYFLTPNVPSYFPPLAFAIDFANNTAAIPGSGNVPAVFTHTWDVARYVAPMLDSPKWKKRSYIIGEKLTWNEFLEIAEEAKGVKFEVVYDGLGRVKELVMETWGKGK